MQRFVFAALRHALRREETRRGPEGGIFIAMGGGVAVLALFLIPLSVSAAPCAEYTRASQTPAGYAPPVSWYTNTLLLNADCTGTQATLTVGDNSPTTYVYDTAYYHTGTSWVPLTLTGTGKQGRWIPRKATASFTLPQPATYVAAYTCEWQGNTWRCGCTTPACTQRAWQLQRVRGEEAGSIAPRATDFSHIASGSWQRAAADTFGWLTEQDLQSAKARGQYAFAAAPDGTRAVRHRVLPGMQVFPPGWDSPYASVPTTARYYVLRYNMWQEGFQGREGKFMALMGGRGLAGSQYARPASSAVGNDGWSMVSMHPTNRFKSDPRRATNAFGCYVYSWNRGELGGKLNARTKNYHGATLPRTNADIPTGRWVTVDVVVKMNRPGKRDGGGYVFVDGVRRCGADTGIMWYGPGKTWKNIWMRWRIMNGGNPEALIQEQPVTEWYRDFELWYLP